MKLLSRKEIVDELLNQDRGASYHYQWYDLTWNIKVYDFETDGRTFSDGTHICVGVTKEYGEVVNHYNTDKWDDRWEEFAQRVADDEEDWLFWGACEEWKGWIGPHNQYDLLEFHDDKDLNSCTFEFDIHGRSGGALCLSKFNGYVVRQWEIEDAEQWEYLELWQLYKFVKFIDRLVETRHRHMEQFYADYRSAKESDWNDEAMEAVQARQLVLAETQP